MSSPSPQTEQNSPKAHGSQSGRPSSWSNRLRVFFETPSTEYFVAAIVLINAVTLGLETSKAAMAVAGPFLLVLDRIILGFFVVELLGRMVAYQRDFFKDGWRIFDLIVVGVALIPASGPLSVLRALRILRVLRLISLVPSLKRVVGAMVAALPGMGSVLLLLGLVFYVASVIATKLYAESFPQWFGTIGESAYSLFQIMTLESWSMGIVRPVMEQYPYAWAFFVVFILFSSFMVINLLIGIIVGAMQEEHERTLKEEAEAAGIDLSQNDDLVRLQKEVSGLREEIRGLRDVLKTTHQD